MFNFTELIFKILVFLGIKFIDFQKCSNDNFSIRDNGIEILPLSCADSRQKKLTLQILSAKPCALLIFILIVNVRHYTFQYC